MVCNKQKRVSKQEAAGGHGGVNRERTNGNNAKPQKPPGSAPVAFCKGKTRRGVFGKEVCLVKNEQHKTAPKRKKRLNPAKEGHNKFLFN